MKHGLDEASAGIGLALDASAVERLEAFERLLSGKAVEFGFVSAADRHRIRERHILDCLRAVQVLRGDEVVYDLGSGAGLPGIVVAAACPTVRMTLVEARTKRVAFLEMAIDAIGLANVRVVSGRVEDLTEGADACLSRAFAPFDRAWRSAKRILRPGGKLVFFAGRTFETPAVPDDATLQVLDAPALLESSGPLVIMTRQ